MREMTMKKFVFAIASLALAFAIATPVHAQTISHEADLTYGDAACTTATPCNLQVYRALCSSATSCPSFVSSPTSFNALSTSICTATVGVATTTWQCVDTDSKLLDSTTYEWVALAAYQSFPAAWSGPSNPFQGTLAGPPQAPTSSGTIKR
jgi:hypothetical protein